MKWAFWRRDSSAAAGRRNAARENALADTGEPDAQRSLRVQARRRLIGAAALLLAAVIVVPMVLDPAPRPLPEQVPIEIPSERTPFHPRLPMAAPGPAVATPDQATPPGPGGDSVLADPKPGEPKAGNGESRAQAREQVGAGDAAPTAGASEATRPAAVPTPADRVAGAAGQARDPARAADAQRARQILDGKPAPAAAPAGEARFFVQAAAPRNEQAARELAARLKKAGLPSFTERVAASDGTRWRVRVGPYASRQEAERARARLRELGTGADLIAP